MYGFLLGLTGSWHCIAMCGPIMSFFLKDGQKNYLNSTLYQIGRIGMYALLGYWVAYLGTIGLFAKFWYVYFITVGLFIALLLLGIIKDQSFSMLHNLLGKPLQTLGKKTGILRFFFFGLANGLLPCGLVMAGLSTSLIQSNPISGAVNMIYFGLGTLPALLLTLLGFHKAQQFKNLFGSRILQVISWLVVIALLFQGIWGVLVQLSDTIKNHPLTPIICH